MLINSKYNYPTSNIREQRSTTEVLVHMCTHPLTTNTHQHTPCTHDQSYKDLVCATDAALSL
jgi:hypothetical protein